MWRRMSLWEELRKMQEELDYLAERGWKGPEIGAGMDTPLLADSATRNNAIVPSGYRKPLTDYIENDKEITASVELPGVSKEDIKINTKENGIEIRVEKRQEKKDEDKKKGYFRLERSYSGFYRYIGLPKNADQSKINASYKEGILEIKIPKMESKDLHSREIKIN
jgi:HSP20 family protein